MLIREVHLTLSTLDRFDLGRDSGNLKYANTNETRDRPPAAIHGSKYGYVSKIVSTNISQRAAGLDNSPPMNGPMVKPRPNAAPIIPILVVN